MPSEKQKKQTEKYNTFSLLQSSEKYIYYCNICIFFENPDIWKISCKISKSQMRLTSVKIPSFIYGNSLLSLYPLSD
ncbi:TPA: hypothetical protein ACQ62H_002129 [Neisseria polysaccharea]